MTITAENVVTHYSRQAIQITRVETALNEALEEFQAQVPALEAQRNASRTELGQAYLPVLSQPDVERAERITGFRGFTRRNPLEAMAREIAFLQKTVTQIEADEDYRRREYLVGEHGSLALALAEVQSMLEPWEQECARFEELEGFVELVEVGYDTPAFSVSFLSPLYWKLWSRGDRICAALDMADFGDDVLPAYTRALAERTRWRAELARAEAEVECIHERVRQHDEALARLPNLPAAYLEQCQGLLADFFEHADLALLEQWQQEEGGDRALIMGLRKLAGLQAKLEYLRELMDGVREVKAELLARRAKYRRKADKYRRPKYRSTYIPSSTLDQPFEPKADKLLVSLDRTRKLSRRLAAYDDYGRFPLSNDPELWWVELTGSRPTTFTPELRAWYARQQPSGPLHDGTVDPDTAVVAMVGARAAQDEEEAGGYLS